MVLLNCELKSYIKYPQFPVKISLFFCLSAPASYSCLLQYGPCLVEVQELKTLISRSLKITAIITYSDGNKTVTAFLTIAKQKINLKTGDNYLQNIRINISLLTRQVHLYLRNSFKPKKQMG